jgi:Putative nucleotidyltransferase DUF294
MPINVSASNRDTTEQERIHQTESNSKLQLEQRWLNVIQRLQTLIIQSLDQDQIPLALRLSQAVCVILLASEMPGRGRSELRLPPQSLGKLLQEDFLLLLAPHFDENTLEIIREGCCYAATLPELATQASKLHLMPAKLNKIPRTSQVTNLLLSLDEIQKGLSRCVRSYAAAKRVNKPDEAAEAFAQIEAEETKFISALVESAWNYYAYLPKVTRHVASDYADLHYQGVPSDAYLVILEWLVDLTERQVQAKYQVYQIPVYRSRLEALRQTYNTISSDLSATENFPKVGSNLTTAQRAFSHGVRALFVQMLHDSETILGFAPCAYTLVGFGSLSRDEMLPYSDLECALILQPELEIAQAC